MSEFLKVTEVAERLRISRQGVDKAIKTGRLPAIKIGNLWRIRKDDLERYINDGGDTYDRQCK